MIIISYSTEDNSDSLRRNRWHIGNTLIAVLHLRRVFPQSAVSNTHVNMEAGYWVKQMVRLDFPIIFIFSAYIFSLENTFYEFFFCLPLSCIAFPWIMLFSAQFLLFFCQARGCLMSYLISNTVTRSLLHPVLLCYAPATSQGLNAVPPAECIN